MRRSVNLRVRLIQAAGGEGNHHPLTKAELAEMQRIITFRNPPGAADAIAYLDSLKDGALDGVPRHTGIELGDVLEALKTRVPSVIAKIRSGLAALVSKPAPVTIETSTEGSEA